MTLSDIDQIRAAVVVLNADLDPGVNADAIAALEIDVAAAQVDIAALDDRITALEA